MPKGKKKSKGGAAPRPKYEASQLTGSEDESNFDTSSVMSYASDSKYGSDEGTVGEPESEENILHDDFEDKLKEAIDGTSQKSAKGRLTCFEMIRKALSSRHTYNFISERKITVTDMLERGLKKGRGEEQGSAALLAAVIAIQFGAGEDCENLFNDLQTYLISLLTDPSVSALVRAKCATSLGLLCFIAESENEVVIQHIMDSLYSVFRDSFLKGNGAVPSHTPEVAALHSSALLAWGLLLTISSVDRVFNLAESQLKKLAEVLESSDLELRIAAGEVIAILYELARDYDQTFKGDKMDELCEKLKQLATDSQKFRAKKDRRQQRSSFRDILRAVQENSFPGITVKFGREMLDIHSWCRKRQYDAFCQVLGSGMNLHLTVNDLLRDIFELGAPLTNGNLVPKVSKFERHMVNVASCRARTKTRNKLRDKRADIIG